MARLEVAQQELERRVLELRDRRRSQETLLARLEQERGKVRDRAELLSEKYEDVKDRGQELSTRVENVLSKLQAKIPQLSDKELAMAREVSGLDRKVRSLEGGALLHPGVWGSAACQFRHPVTLMIFQWLWTAMG